MDSLEGLLQTPIHLIMGGCEVVQIDLTVDRGWPGTVRMWSMYDGFHAVLEVGRGVGQTERHPGPLEFPPMTYKGG